MKTKTPLTPRICGAFVAGALALALPLGVQAERSSTPSLGTPATRPSFVSEAERERHAAERRGDKNTFNRSDRRLVKKVAACNAFEIALSRQAAGRSPNAQVRAYAEQIVRDHERMGRELTTLAARRALTLPTTYDHQEDLTDLAKESGNKYDEGYLEEMIESHEESIKVLEKVSKSRDSDLAAFAVQHLAAMRDHLARAKQLEEAIDD